MANTNNKQATLTTTQICNSALAANVDLSKRFTIQQLELIRDNYAKACSTPQQLALFVRASLKYGVSIERGEIHAMPAGGYVERVDDSGRKVKVWVDAVVPVIDYKVYTRKLAARNIYIKSAPVFANDTFIYDYAAQKPKVHLPPEKGERGRPVAAWASANINGEVYGVCVLWEECVRTRPEYNNNGQKTGRDIPMAQWATKPAFSIEKAAVRRLATRLSAEFEEYPDDSNFDATSATQGGAIETPFTVNDSGPIGQSDITDDEASEDTELSAPSLPADVVVVCKDICKLVSDINNSSETPLPESGVLNLVAKHTDGGESAWAHVQAMANETASIDAVKDVVVYKTLRKGLREQLKKLTEPAQAPLQQ